MNRTVRTALLLFAVTLAVRLAVGVWTGLGREPVEDERGYVRLAQSVAEDHELRMERLYQAHGEVIRWSFRGPVVPLVFAPFARPWDPFRLTEKSTGVDKMRLVAILLGALGPPLLFLAARRGPLGDRAWWTGLAYALWPPAIYVSVRALSEAPSQALFLGGMALLCLPRTKGGVLGGALAALAVLARPAALFPAGLLVFATGSRRRAIGFLVAFMAVLAPWEIRNYRLHGRVLLTTNTGVTLVGGNSQAAADADPPGKWVPPENVYAGAADAPPSEMDLWGWWDLSEEASDRRFTADALRWVGEHPGAAVRLCLWKIVRLFDPDPHSGKDDAGSKAIVGWLTLTPVLLLAIFGLGAWRTEWPCTLLVVGTVATAFLFYGDTRMRTCADPALLVFAVHGATRVARRVRGAGLD